MDKLYEFMNQSVFASSGAFTFGVLVSICVAVAILWLRYAFKSKRVAITQAHKARPIDPIPPKLEEQGPAVASAKSAWSFGGVEAALRKMHANDAQKKASPINDTQSSSRRPLQSSGRSRVPGQPISAAAASDGQRKTAENQISEPEALEAEKSKYPRAWTAIEYREDVKKAWEEIGHLSEFVRYEFLSALDQNPRFDVRELAATILQKLEEERRRFDSDELNNAYRAAAQISKDAADEFRRVVVLLGATVDPDNLLVKIREKFIKQDHPTE